MFTYAFQGDLCRFGIGKTRVIWYVVLFVPPELAASLPFEQHPRLRVRGEIQGEPVDGAFIPAGDGRWYFIVSPRVRRHAGVDIGSTVNMRFVVDEQDRVEVPSELARELRRDRELQAAWETLTPGKRRGIAHLVKTAKTPRTRENRVLAAVESILDLARRR